MESRVNQRSEIIQSLQKEILALQGHRRAVDDNLPSADLGPILAAFPEQIFPIGAVHEFISYDNEDTAATAGFISGIAGQLMDGKGTAFWISPRRTIFPPALKIFGVRPERIIFMELPKQKECLWAIEEALKCKSASVVVGEIGELTFPESRRLQLAVENSNVTGFIHRIKPRIVGNVACVSRWFIRHLPSNNSEIIGVGVPRWSVDLTKVRNGRPGSWQIEWFEKHFQDISQPEIAIRKIHALKTG
ncbi:MAG: Error-prone repair protein ImuA [Bacteroidetes bacterium]|nr:Error-prone repair protein ImuA [Bacteroidota bacterium]